MIQESRLRDDSDISPQGFAPASVAASPKSAAPAASDDTAVLDWVREYIRRGEPGTQQRVSKESDVKSSTLSQLLSGTYKGDVAKQVASLRKWRTQQEAQASMAVSAPLPVGYVATESSATILQALTFAQTLGDIAVLHGGWGIGKTMTAEQYRDTHSSVWIVTIDPTTRGVGPLMELVAETLGMKDQPLHPARLRRAILERVRGTQGLLIVDEAQHLSDQALEALRSIHDASKVGLAFLGNDQVYSAISSKRDKYGQVFSRVGYRKRFVSVPEADVETLTRAHGIEGKAEIAYLKKVGKTPGALRRVNKVIVLATMLAAGAGVPVTLDHLHMAVRHSGRAEEVM